LVEDDQDVREALEMALQAEGYLVVCRVECQAAWTYLQGCSTYPDLILLDLMTPVMTGWQFLQRAAAQTPAWHAVPILVFSAATIPPDADLRPAVVVLHKPIDLVDLFAVIEEWDGQ
jgi:two-component system chemotaxis response regulator CheY